MIRKKSDNLNEVTYMLKMTRVELDTWVQGGKESIFWELKNELFVLFHFLLT